jgi:uncharacterized protein YndB with AHSA1/START domain
MPTEEGVEAGPVECEIRIDASPETVFPFFTDPERMVRWKGEAATLDPRPGGVYRVGVLPEHTASGEYVEVDPPRRVAFTWGWEEGDSPVKPGTSRVEVELVPDGEGTLVRLTHRDLPAESRGPHREGWVHYLGRLSIAAAGGDPGPDRGPRSPAGDS